MKKIFLSILCLCLATNVNADHNTENTPAVKYPELSQSRDAYLQHSLDQALLELELDQAIHINELSVTLVDITNPLKPRYADKNGLHMMYAASLPKIAILFGLYKKIEEGALPQSEEIHLLAEQMIRVSSNSAATLLYKKVTPKYIQGILSSPTYNFYEPKYGGLWVGKEYGSGKAWRRDPLKNLSHAANALQVARFYYFLETGRLVNPSLSNEMKEILSNPGINHKFVKGLSACAPSAKVFRKSGSWQTFHSDSAIVTHGNKKYILVGLANNPNGALWLEKLAQKADAIILSQPSDAHA